MTESTVLFVREGAVARLTLNRPTVGNAIDQPMADALLAAVSACDTDAEVRCVVLSGAGRLFCAGGDITSFAADLTAMPAALGRLAGTVHQAVVKLAGMRKPLLTIVNGPAAGAGMSLAIMGDVVLCARSAHFTAAYGAIGLSPDGGMTWYLPRLVGLRRAQEMILSNRRVAAPEAEAIGLVTRAVDDAALVEEGARVAASLTRCAVGALSSARRLLCGSSLVSLDGQLQAEAESIVEMARAAEAREGVSAYGEKRKPDFEGAE